MKALFSVRPSLSVLVASGIVAIVCGVLLAIHADVSWHDGKGETLHLVFVGSAAATSVLLALLLFIEIILRQRTEQALALSEQRYRKVFNAGYHGLIILGGHSFRILDVNDAASRMYGYSRVELLAMHVPQLSSDPSLCAKTIRELVEHTHSRTFVRRHRRKDGSEFVGEVYTGLFEQASPTTNEPMLVVAVMDITERREVEARMQRYSEDLEAAQREQAFYARRLERLVTALQEQKAKVESAARMRMEFFARMSHEIRTPMTAILGFASIIHSDSSPERTMEAIDIIKRHGAHLLELLDGILDLSRVEADRMPVTMRDFSLGEILCEVVAMLEPRARQRGLFLHKVIEPGVPAFMRTDPLRLRQILLNLVSNAINYTDRGGVVLRIRASTSSIIFVIKDSGRGIPTEDHARLFQPFSQVDIGPSQSSKGTGLGLAISQGLARLLGGQIQVESHEGEGSEFALIFPRNTLGQCPRLPANQASCTQGQISPAKRARSRESMETALDSHALDGISILVAEDGLDNQKLYRYILEHYGAHVTLVGDGLEAVQLFQAAGHKEQAVKVTWPFDIILMDVQMPRMDGYAATRWLRSQGCKHPILALTAHVMAEEARRCLEGGFDDFVTKPVSPEVLVRTVRAHFERFCQAEGKRLSPEAGKIALLGNQTGFATIAQEFSSQLAQRASAIDQAIARPDLLRARTLAHQLAGAAGGYGFLHVTEAARTLEQSLNTAIAGQVSQPASLERVRLAMDALLQALPERVQ